MTPPDDYLAIGAVLFALGALGFTTRRNLILMMLSAELMLHGVSLNLIGFSSTWGTFEGQAFTAFVLTVAACEAGIGLALTLTLYRRRRSLDVNLWSGLGEPVEHRQRESEPLSAAMAVDATSTDAVADTSGIEEPAPLRLSPAGRMPIERLESMDARREVTRV